MYQKFIIDSSYNASNTLNQEDLFTCGASGIDASDIVNVVSVGARYANITAADATTAIKLEIMKTSGGTKQQSAAFTRNNTNFQTNTNAQASVYKLITYQDPDGGNWHKATLDSLQIGYILSMANTDPIGISTVWTLVEYTQQVTNSGFLPFFVK